MSKTREGTMETFKGLDDSEDFSGSDDFIDAADEIEAYVTNRKVVTFAEISRRFPQYLRQLDTICEHLRTEGRIFWEDWRPLPTLIYAGDRRIQDVHYDWRSVRDRTWAQREI